MEEEKKFKRVHKKCVCVFFLPSVYISRIQKSIRLCENAHNFCEYLQTSYDKKKYNSPLFSSMGGRASVKIKIKSSEQLPSMAKLHKAGEIDEFFLHSVDLSQTNLIYLFFF